MSNKISESKKGLSLFDWMLAIDIDPTRYRLKRSEADFLAKTLLV